MNSIICRGFLFSKGGAAVLLWAAAVCVAASTLLADGQESKALVWEIMETPTTTTLNAVKVFGTKNIVVSGANSTVLRFDGAEWSHFGGMIAADPPVPFNADNVSGGWGSNGLLRALGGVSVSDFWVGSYDTPRLMSRWNGSEWSPLERGGPNDDRIMGIWAGAADLVVTARSNGRITVFDGVKWTRIVNLSGTFNGVDGVPEGEIWVVGSVPNMMVAVSEDNGQTWTAREDGFPDLGVKQRVSTLDAQHTWILCAKGIAFWDGERYTTQYEHTGSGGLNAITAFDSSNVWATGDYNIVLHFDGSQWREVEYGLKLPGKHLYDITLDPLGQVYAVGSDGTILRGRFSYGTLFTVQ